MEQIPQNDTTTRDLPPDERSENRSESRSDEANIGNGIIDEGEDPGLTPGETAPESPYDSMTGEGKLIFRVTTASGAIPLTGAQITVRKHLPDTPVTAEGDTLAVLYSGQDGKTDALPLPAPARSLSLEQAPAGAPLPFALYNAEVILAGYYRQDYTRIPVFDGVTAIQRVDLVPLPASSLPDSIGEPRRDIPEGVSPAL